MLDIMFFNNGLLEKQSYQILNHYNDDDLYAFHDFQLTKFIIF